MKKAALTLLALVALCAAVPTIAGGTFTADKVVAPQVAKAGAVWDGDTADCPAGVCVVQDGFNVASITWTSAGDYDIELTDALSSATAYNIQVTCRGEVPSWDITDANSLHVKAIDPTTGNDADSQCALVIFDF